MKMFLQCSMLCRYLCFCSQRIQDMKTPDAEQDKNIKSAVTQGAPRGRLSAMPPARRGSFAPSMPRRA